jgi:5'-phosphate synthase pdxT subunit
LRLLADDRLDDALQRRIAEGMPTLATCAGVILLAMRVEPPQRSLAVLDVTVQRNAYGRQVHSTVAPVSLDADLGTPATVDGVFIRAPRIVAVGSGVRILGRRGADPVLVEQPPLLAVTYHPELGGDDRVHRRFVARLEACHV